MQIIKFNKIPCKIGEKIHVLTYEVLQEEQDERFHYGIVVMDQTTGEVESVMDITTREDVILELYRTVMVGRVTPMSLRSVVEDHIAGI